MSLAQTLRRLAGVGEGEGPSPSRAKVVAVTAQKGGVGKTTTAVSLASAAARYHGLKTLLVDLDGQGHVATSLAAHFRDGSPTTLSDLLLGHRRDLCEIVHKTGVENLFVTPSDKGLSVTEGIIAGRIGKEFLLRGIMKQARERFDLIVIDCPPNLGNLTLNGLVASDACIVPCDMSVLALQGVSDLLAVLETIEDRLGHRVELLGILPTKVDRRNPKVTDAVLEELRNTYGHLLFDTFIPVSSALSRAQMEGVSIFDYDERSPGALAYRELCERVLEKLRAITG